MIKQVLRTLLKNELIKLKDNYKFRLDLFRYIENAFEHIVYTMASFIELILLAIRSIEYIFV